MSEKIRSLLIPMHIWLCSWETTQCSVFVVRQNLPWLENNVFIFFYKSLTFKMDSTKIYICYSWCWIQLVKHFSLNSCFLVYIFRSVSPLSVGAVNFICLLPKCNRIHKHASSLSLFMVENSKQKTVKNKQSGLLLLCLDVLKLTIDFEKYWNTQWPTYHLTWLQLLYKFFEFREM